MHDDRHTSSLHDAYMYVLILALLRLMATPALCSALAVAALKLFFKVHCSLYTPRNYNADLGAAM